MFVKEIMTEKVKTVGPLDSVKDVVVMICTGHFSGAPVVDENGDLLGVISEKDILQGMYPSQQEFYDDPVSAKDFEQTRQRYDAVVKAKVSDLMTVGATSIDQDTHILKAASIMLRRKIRRLPVVDGRKLVGLVSQGDIHQAIFRSKLINL